MPYKYDKLILIFIKIFRITKYYNNVIHRYSKMAKIMRNLTVFTLFCVGTLSYFEKHRYQNVFNNHSNQAKSTVDLKSSIKSSK